MAKIIFITGGARSGKSSYAQALGESLPGARLYIATCPPDLDAEIKQRIARHRQQRQEAGWQTAEETIAITEAVENNSQFEVVLIDCLTLWVNNLMYRYGDGLSEDDVNERSSALLSVCRKMGATVIFVTNEVGCGIVPENEQARKFRDLVGRCNQVLAAGADEVVLLVSGIPTTLKGKQSWAC